MSATEQKIQGEGLINLKIKPQKFIQFEHILENNGWMNRILFDCKKVFNTCVNGFSERKGERGKTKNVVKNICLKTLQIWQNTKTYRFNKLSKCQLE